MVRGARGREAEAEGQEEVRLEAMRTAGKDIRFAVCLTARPEEDLQEGKVYRVLPDAQADQVGCLRVIDESGEDYLYAAKRFVLVEVPSKERRRLLKAVAGEEGATRS